MTTSSEPSGGSTRFKHWHDPCAAIEQGIGNDVPQATCSSWPQSRDIAWPFHGTVPQMRAASRRK